MGAIKISKTETVNADADHIWRILSEEFDSVDNWASSVNHSEMNDGATNTPEGAPPGRVCTVPGFGVTDERMTRYDDAERSFAFSVEAEKIPGFFTNMESAWSVEPIAPGRSRVTTKVSGNANGLMGALVSPMMKRKFQKTIDTVYEDLKVYAETGRPSAAKTKADEKYRRQLAKAKG